MSDIRTALRQLEEMEKKSAERTAEVSRNLEKLKGPAGSGERRLHVNKQTHRVRFVNETENEVTIIVEKKAEKG